MNARRLATLGIGLSLFACGSDPPGTEGDVDAAPPGGPPNLAGTPGTWSWIDVPGTKCMNGSATGMGVNLGTSGDLVLFMEGGGACFNDFTCASVVHQNGFGANDLSAAAGSQGVFDRADPNNPLREATFVFFPYCTGDIFAGSNPSGFGGRQQVGYNNVGAYLEQIVPASEPVRRVIVTGASAGGFGALYNYERVKTAFGARPVYLIDDSGPPMPDRWLTPCFQTKLRQLWNLNATLPAGCTACTGADGGGLVNALPYLADKYPDQRLAIVSSTKDGVIRTFYGFGYPSCEGAFHPPMPEAEYTAGIRAVQTDVLGTRKNFRLYAIEGGGHVWTMSPLGGTTSGGKSLGAWLTAMLAGDASWEHVSP